MEKRIIMQKKISIGAIVVAVLLSCIATFMVSYVVLQNKFEEKYFASQTDGADEEDTENGGTPSDVEGNAADRSEFINKIAEKLSIVDKYYRNYYIGEMDDQVLMDSVIAGYVAGTGDKFAAYYTADAFEQFMNEIEGETVGIGISAIFNTDYKLIEVLSVNPDSPADKAGVMPGDLIATIGEEKASVVELGYYPAINMIRGEIGTEVVFSVLRGKDYTESVDFRIIRDRVISQSVLYHVYGPDNSVGYIKVTGFDQQTPQQFVDAVNALKKSGCDKLAIDMRYNPGGELISVVTVLDFLLPEGPIVRIFDASGEEVKRYNSERTELDMPMVILVNDSTASAAELFTSAVRDYDKALVVGTTTYGKGCMQTTLPLDDGSALTITYRMYSPPYSDNYHEIGIVPDIIVELDEALANKNIYKITDEEDNQLAAAVATFYN